MEHVTPILCGCEFGCHTGCRAYFKTFFFKYVVPTYMGYTCMVCRYPQTKEAAQLLLGCGAGWWRGDSEKGTFQHLGLFVGLCCIRVTFLIRMYTVIKIMKRKQILSERHRKKLPPLWKVILGAGGGDNGSVFVVQAPNIPEIYWVHTCWIYDTEIGLIYFKDVKRLLKM